MYGGSFPLPPVDRTLLLLEIDTYIDELVEIFPKLSMKNSTIAYTFWDEFRHHSKCIKMSVDICLCLVVTMNG